MLKVEIIWGDRRAPREPKALITQEQASTKDSHEKTDLHPSSRRKTH